MDGLTDSVRACHNGRNSPHLALCAVMPAKKGSASPQFLDHSLTVSEYCQSSKVQSYVLCMLKPTAQMIVLLNVTQIYGEHP